MIRINSVAIKETRGIRNLSLNLNKKPFAISGPNGSGKSGVVDAVEFCLTGEISRLSGKGTSGITLQKHGPHVASRDNPEAAEVTINAHLVDLGRDVVISRNMKRPTEVSVEPDEPAIRAAVEEVISHPEVVLSRRQIIKYVIAEAGERSSQVQELLRLDRIGQIRSALGTTHNRLKANYEQALQNKNNARDELKRHLEIQVASEENVLAVINQRRKAIGLEEIKALLGASRIDVGLDRSSTVPTLDRQSTERDIEALSVVLTAWPVNITDTISLILQDIVVIENDVTLLQLLENETFFKKGMDLIEAALCPLCDVEWADIETLRAHIAEKVAKSSAAEELKARVLNNAGALAKSVRTLAALVNSVKPAVAAVGSVAEQTLFAQWSTTLQDLLGSMTTLLGVLKSKDDLQKRCAAISTDLLPTVRALSERVKAEPDKKESLETQAFLIRAQDRLMADRAARQKEIAAGKAMSAAKKAYDTYCAVAKEFLDALYAAVEEDFSDYYRQLNEGDESGFRAKLEQGPGKLDLSVDFYGTGLFPPGAYHSEGHQDGMGVCLYLALMRQVLGERFCFAVLDDVVMSIDRSHRQAFCRLLRNEFPNTQFVITTHDAIWAKQMKSEGLIGPRAIIELQSWSVDTGPVVEDDDVWESIEVDLARNDVRGAAARLRYHLEYVYAEQADMLAAPIPYKGDASYELGELCQATLGRQRELLAMAARSANSWNNGTDIERIREIQEARKAALAEKTSEDWAINLAIHYNEWADLSPGDFRPVVASAKTALDQFKCRKEECGSLLYPSPRDRPEQLRCRCGEINFNLSEKTSAI